MMDLSGPASMVYKFFEKKSKEMVLIYHQSLMKNQLKNYTNQLLEIFKNVYSGSEDNIWGADLADIQLISNFNKGFRVLLRVTDIFSKYAWVFPLKDKKGVRIVDAFKKILDDFNRKPNKILADKGSEFYNSSSKKWLKDNDIEMHSIHNEGKSVVAEIFIKTLKTKIFKYTNSILKNVYIYKLDDIVNEYNNAHHRTIKMRPVDVKDNTFIDFKIEVNDKDSKYKVGDHVRISKYKNIFAKVYTPIWSE